MKMLLITAAVIGLTAPAFAQEPAPSGSMSPGAQTAPMADPAAPTATPDGMQGQPTPPAGDMAAPAPAGDMAAPPAAGAPGMTPPAPGTAAEPGMAPAPSDTPPSSSTMPSSDSASPAMSPAAAGGGMASADLPRCSRTVTDKCIQRGAAPRSRGR